MQCVPLVGLFKLAHQSPGRARTTVQVLARLPECAGDNYTRGNAEHGLQFFLLCGDNKGTEVTNSDRERPFAFVKTWYECKTYVSSTPRAGRSFPPSRRSEVDLFTPAQHRVRITPRFFVFWRFSEIPDCAIFTAFVFCFAGIGF